MTFLSSQIYAICINKLEFKMPVFNRLNLKCPCFDLAWLLIPSSENRDESSFILVPGGGGSTKSGVDNIIHVARDSKVLGAFEFVNNFETGILCNSISTGIIKNNPIVCASFDDIVRLYTVETTDSTNELSFKKVAEYKADFSEELPSVNCSAIISRASSSGYVITGGEDGVIRVWTVSLEDTGSWTVEKKSELMGHTGHIMSLSIASPRLKVPTSNPSIPFVEHWVASGAKDGSLRIWDVKRGCLLVEKVLEPLAAAETNQGQKRPPVATKPQSLQCRGAVFSGDSSYLFHIQSGLRGVTHLVKSKINVNIEQRNDNGDDKGENQSTGDVKITVDLETILYVAVSKVPCTRLRISDAPLLSSHSPTGTAAAAIQLLAVGGSDGTLTVLRSTDLTLVLKIPEVHDFPVTGLGFRPPSLGLQAIASVEFPVKKEALEVLDGSWQDGITLVSCSADNKFISTQVQLRKKSFLSIGLIFSILVLILAILLGLYYNLGHEQSLVLWKQVIDEVLRITKL